MIIIIITVLYYSTYLTYSTYFKPFFNGMWSTLPSRLLASQPASPAIFAV